MKATIVSISKTKEVEGKDLFVVTLGVQTPNGSIRKAQLLGEFTEGAIKESFELSPKQIAELVVTE